MRALVFVLCLAACDSGKRPSTRDDAAVARALEADAIAIVAAPVDAAVAVAVAAIGADAAPDPMARFYDVPMAMVANGGSEVLLRIIDPDGARAAPNLAFEVRDRNDRKTASAAILKLDEEPTAETLAKRATAVDRIFARHQFERMTELAGDRDTGRFQGDGFAVDLTGGHLTIKHKGKTVVDRDVPAAWLSKPYYLKSEELTCTNPELLSRVFVAAEAQLAVVEVRYRGNDTCWEPSPQLHVVAW
jgi:hypothetical protein